MLLDHLASEDLIGAKRAVQVDIDHPLPVFIGKLGRRRLLQRAGRNHQDVDLPEHQHHFLAQGVEAGAVLHIAREPQRFRSQLFKLVRHGVDLGLVAAAGDGDGAGLGESARDGLADAAGASEHDGHLILYREQFERAHKQVMIQYGIRFPETYL